MALGATQSSEHRNPPTFAMSDTPRLTAYYADLSSSEFAEAYSAGPSAYQPAVWQIIEVEHAKRGVPEALAPASLPEVGVSDASIKEAAKMLASGSTPDAVVAEFQRKGYGAANTSTLIGDAETYLHNELALGKREVRRAKQWLALGVALFAVSFFISGRMFLSVPAYGSLLIGIVDLIRGNARVERVRGINPLSGRRRGI